MGQTFVATHTGKLHSTSLLILDHLVEGSATPLEFSVVSMLGERSLVEVMDIASVLYETVPHYSHWDKPYEIGYSVTAYFEGGIYLEKGERYAIVVGSPGGSHYRIWGPAGLPALLFPYTDGEMFENDAHGLEWSLSQDFFFQVTVETIPEPGITSIALLSGVVLLMRRKVAREKRPGSPHVH